MHHFQMLAVFLSPFMPEDVDKPHIFFNGQNAAAQP